MIFMKQHKKWKFMVFYFIFVICFAEFFALSNPAPLNFPSSMSISVYVLFVPGRKNPTVVSEISTVDPLQSCKSKTMQTFLTT